MLPVLVVAALLQFIDTNGAVLEGRIAIFNSRREYERRGCRMGTPGCRAGACEGHR